MTSVPGLNNTANQQINDYSVYRLTVLCSTCCNFIVIMNNIPDRVACIRKGMRDIFIGLGVYMPHKYSKPIGLVIWFKYFTDTKFCYVLSHVKQPYPFAECRISDTDVLHTLNYYFKNSNMV